MNLHWICFLVLVLFVFWGERHSRLWHRLSKHQSARKGGVWRRRRDLFFSSWININKRKLCALHNWRKSSSRKWLVIHPAWICFIKKNSVIGTAINRITISSPLWWGGCSIIEHLVLDVHLMAENVFVEVIIDPISSMANNDSTQTSCLCLTIVRAFKCVCVEMLGTSSLSCVAHWPRFQLFSARDNGRNGFITEHNTWVLFSTIVFKVLSMAWFGAVHCVRYPLWSLLTQPAMSTELTKPLIILLQLLQQMVVRSLPPTHFVQRMAIKSSMQVFHSFFILSHFRSFLLVLQNFHALIPFIRKPVRLLTISTRFNLHVYLGLSSRNFLFVSNIGCSSTVLISFAENNSGGCDKKHLALKVVLHVKCMPTGSQTNEKWPHRIWTG